MFEFVDHTVLDELERYPNGLDENTVRKVLWQVLRAIEFCHNHYVSTIIYLTSFGIGLSKVAGCQPKSPPTWLVSTGYSSWHFFMDGVFLITNPWTGRLL